MAISSQRPIYSQTKYIEIQFLFEPLTPKHRFKLKVWHNALHIYIHLNVNKVKVHSKDGTFSYAASYRQVDKEGAVN